MNLQFLRIIGASKIIQKISQKLKMQFIDSFQQMVVRFFVNYWCVVFI